MAVLSNPSPSTATLHLVGTYHMLAELKRISLLCYVGFYILFKNYSSSIFFADNTAPALHNRAADIS